MDLIWSELDPGNTGVRRLICFWITLTVIIL